MAEQGWECPKCGSVYSPTTNDCGRCNNPANNGTIIQIGPRARTRDSGSISGDSHDAGPMAPGSNDSSMSPTGNALRRGPRTRIDTVEVPLQSQHEDVWTPPEDIKPETPPYLTNEQRAAWDRSLLENTKPPLIHRAPQKDEDAIVLTDESGTVTEDGLII